MRASDDDDSRLRLKDIKRERNEPCSTVVTHKQKLGHPLIFPDFLVVYEKEDAYLDWAI